MPKEYHNVFHYYRGPSARPDTEQPDPQIENNTTKALINVLDLSIHHDRLQVLQSFLNQAFGIVVRELREVSYELQVNGDTSRPDAAIYLENPKCAIFIESKVKAALKTDQIERHMRTRPDYLLVITDFQDDIEILRPLIAQYKGKIKHTTWETLWGWSLKLLSDQSVKLQPVTEFLLQQFREYLEMKGITLGALGADWSFELRREWVRKFAEELVRGSDLSAGRLYPKWSGLPIGEEKEDAHYHLYLQERQIVLGLTLKKIQKKRLARSRELIVEFFRGAFKHEDQNLRWRYSIAAGKYYSIDRSQNGELRDAFRFCFCIRDCLTQEELQKRFSIFLDPKTPFGIARDRLSQFDIEYKVGIIESTRAKDIGLKHPNDIRVLDYGLISDPDKLLEEFKGFIEATRKIREAWNLA